MKITPAPARSARTMNRTPTDRATVVVDARTLPVVDGAIGERGRVAAPARVEKLVGAAVIGARSHTAAAKVAEGECRRRHEEHRHSSRRTDDAGHLGTAQAFPPRRRPGRQGDIPFGEAVERLCANGRWPLPTDSPILPLGAAVSEVDSLGIWLGKEPEGEEDIEAVREPPSPSPPSATRPVPVTSATRMRKTSSEWERHRARDVRSGRHSHRRRLHSHLTRSDEALPRRVRGWGRHLRSARVPASVRTSWRAVPGAVEAGRTWCCGCLSRRWFGVRPVVPAGQVGWV